MCRCAQSCWSDPTLHLLTVGLCDQHSLISNFAATHPCPVGPPIRLTDSLNHPTTPATTPHLYFFFLPHTLSSCSRRTIPGDAGMPSRTIDLGAPPLSQGTAHVPHGSNHHTTRWGSGPTTPAPRMTNMPHPFRPSPTPPRPASPSPPHASTRALPPIIHNQEMTNRKT